MGLVRNRKPKYDFKIGEQYGNWLIIDKDIDPRNGKVRYKVECQCEFKTISYKNASALASKDNNVCIKCHNKNQGYKINIGDRFRNWIVIDIAKSKNGRNFLCQCDCKFKTIQIFSSTVLRTSNRKGCVKCCHDSRRKELIGQTINNWTVLEDLGYTGKIRLYKCQCNCEYKTIGKVSWNVLKSKTAFYCFKCCPKGGGGKYLGEGRLSSHNYSSIKWTAQDRGIPFEVSIKFLSELYTKQRGYCALSNFPIFLQKSVTEDILPTASLDRTNSNGSYSEDNVQWVHKIANKIKWLKSMNDLLQICHKVITYPLKDDLPKIDYQIRKRILKQEGSYGDISISNWNWLLRNAKVRELEFNLTKEYLWDLFVKQGFRCAITGDPLIFHYKHKNMTASLDRIDNRFGYIEGNVHWVHKDVNRMKWHYSIGTFRYICRMIYENHNNFNLIF